MIGILLPVSALGLMLQRPLNTLNTKPLSATGPGTRAVVPLRMGGKGFFEKAEDKFEGFVENVEDKIEGFVEGVEDKIEGFVEGVEDKIEGFVEGVDDKITEAAEDKIKEAIENQIKALVANTGEDSEHKSAGWGGEGSGPDKERILAAVETIVAGRREEVAGGVTNRQLEILKILKFFNLPVIADELIQTLSSMCCCCSLPQSSFGGGRRPGTTSRAPTVRPKSPSRRATSGRTSGRTSSSQTCARAVSTQRFDPTVTSSRQGV